MNSIIKQTLKLLSVTVLSTIFATVSATANTQVSKEKSDANKAKVNQGAEPSGVWNYQLVTNKPGVEIPANSHMIIANKGTRFVVYKCDREALSEFTRLQLEDTVFTPSNLRSVLESAVQSPGCQFAVPVMFTVTKQFMSESWSYVLKTEDSGWGFFGGVTGFVGAIYAMIHRTIVLERRGRIGYNIFWGGMLFGPLGAYFGSSIASSFGKSLAEKETGDIKTSLRHLPTETSVLFIDNSVDELISATVRGLQKMSELGYAISSDISQKSE